MLSLAGCGGSHHLSKSAFQQKLGPIAEQFRKDSAPLSGQAETPEQLVAAIDAARAAHVHLADQLAGLDAPTEVAAERDSVVRIVRQEAAALVQALDFYRAQDAPKEKAAFRQFNALGRDQVAGLARLRDKLVAR